MNKHSFHIIVSALAVLMSTLVVRANSSYSNEVVSLKPAAYWPLQLTNTTAVHLATNSGTLGAIADAHYDNAFYSVDGTNYDIKSLFPGPGPGVTSDGDAGAKFNGGTNGDDNSQYLIIPDVNNDLDQGGAVFTAEAWVYPQGGDPNDVTGTSFASTEWTSIMEKGGGGFGWTVAGDANGNTYGWSMELAGIYSLGAPVGWYGGTPYAGSGPVQILTNACWVVDFFNGANGGTPALEFDVPMYETTPQWFHLVLTYDGVNAYFYTNGVLAATTEPGLPQSTNDVFAPADEQASGFQSNWPTSPNGNYQFPSTGFAPDTINPLAIGNINPSSSISDAGYPQANAIGYNCQNFNGIMDELAFYTNSLPAAAVLKHYQDATASNHTLYTNDVLSANPPVYLRFDEPVYTADPASGFIGFPVVANYGFVGSVGSGYQVNVVPGLPGPQLPGLGSDTNAILCDGMDAAVDVGNGGNLYKSVLDPTNHQPFSVALWAKSNPADIHARFETILGRGDSGWRFDLDQNGDIHFNPGNNPELTSSQSYNDGNWHHLVGVSDGNNDFLYIDGQLSTSGAGVGALGGVQLDLLIGGAPDYSAGSGNRFFSGQISHVAFFTNALSAALVETLYNDAAFLQPIITQNPLDLTANLGASGALSVLASGDPTLGYHWYQGTTKLSDVAGNIVGSASPTLLITNALNSNAGEYTVVITNAYGAVTSAPVSVTIYSSVVVLSETAPATSTLFTGGHVTYSVTAAGASPIGYQWFSNNVAVVNATNTTYALTNAQTAASIYCLITNIYNSVPSTPATLTVISPTSSYPTTIVAANPVGFWRLNEPDNGSGNGGVLANDYWGGNNGVYTNTVLGQPGYNPAEPTETSAIFDALATVNCMVYNISTNVDFSAPSGINSSFSVECWLNGFAQTTDAGIISKGLGGGGEQFDLDTGANDPAHDLRFLVRDASGAAHTANSTFAMDGQWHHVVGVCNEASGYLALYVDGVQLAQGTITAGSGILPSPENMKIGARPPGSDPSTNGDQFAGNMDDVAVYNYALSTAQVQAHYDSANIPAKVTASPTNTVAGVGGTATFTVEVEGTPPLTNQWYNASTGQPIPNATNTTLVLTDVQSGDNGANYYFTTTNAFGGSASVPAQLTVISGTPQIYVDVVSPFFAIQGGTASNTVTAYGTEPLAYQWQLNGTNISSIGGITGSQSNVLTIADALAGEAGGYRVIVSNGSGSVTSSVAQFIVGTSPVSFNINGGGWQVNGNSSIGTNLLTLVNGTGGQDSSFFYSYPQYIGAFKASYTYQDVGGTVGGGADGISFCLQNDPRGASALGGGGGSLGVGTANPITPSAELEFNLYTGGGQAVGYTFLTDGLTAAGAVNGNYLKPGTVVIDDGNPIKVSLYYDGNSLSLTLTDAVANTSFSTNLPVGNLPNVVGGSTAYVGFTGGDGGLVSTQVITNFSFVSIPLASIQPTSTNTVTVSWPAEVLGYGVQRSSSLSVPNWITLTNQVNILNGVNEVIIPIGSTNEFYRLQLQ